MNSNELNKAIDDLRKRSLVSIPTQFAKLVSLSSTRDYNTGRYCHDGLAFRFSAGVAEEALRTVHQEIFQELAFSPLGALVQDLERFIRTAHMGSDNVLHVWMELQPYRMLVPRNCNLILRDLFFSNVRMALAVLEHRQSKASAPSQQFALQPQ